MTLIDQRILIPAPTSAIWAVLADQSLLPQWRVDCQRVSILTTRQFGVGMRRRCHPPRGKDRVEEITAWYEALGYEYVLVDTRLFRTWTSRLRLQATPEGTIVQWTINYEFSGFFARLRSWGKRAQYERELTDSLRQLRRLVETMGYRLDPAEQARKSQTLQPVQRIVRSSSQQIMVPVEDTVADTKPRRPEGLDDAIAQTVTAQPPVPTPPPSPVYSAPPTPARPLTPPAPIPVTPPPAAYQPPPVTPAEPVEKLPPGMPEILKATPPKGIPRVRFADEIEAAEEDAPTYQPVEPDPDTITHQVRPGLPPPTHMTDTGQISIWEAFGVRAPSQLDAEALQEVVKKATGEFPSVRIEAPADIPLPVPEESPSVPIEPVLDSGDTRTFSPLFTASVLRVRPPKEEDQRGLRSKQARQHAKVRPHKSDPGLD